MKASQIIHSKKMIAIAVGAVLLVMIVAALSFRALANKSEPVPYIPESISSSLLFTPYVPTWLPDGYGVDATSYSAEGQALVFAAVKPAAQPITVSEQAMPKDFDMNGFLTSNVTDPARLDDAKYPTVFGKANGRKQNIASVTIDTTWVLLTVPDSVTKDDAKRLVNGLVKQ